MRMVDLIEKKRNNDILTPEEINWMIEDYSSSDGKIEDYQMSALLMAIYFNGMTAEEIGELTISMANSGDTISFKDLPGKTVDKHSTGGVGDTTTLIIAPLVATAGVNMPKMSGRGLGHTGGTLDKLESFPGYDIGISEERFREIIKEIHVAVVGQTANLAPADKKLYALRDVTGTIDSIPLIASSIMSKKLASGADIIILDVKIGSGAFMKTEEEATELAQTMIDIGEHAGKQTLAVISDMSQPLGFGIGNILEVKEAIETLNNRGPNDLRELSITIASHLVYAAGKTESLEEATALLNTNLENGKALENFKQMVQAQGGDGSYIEDPSKFDIASQLIEVKAETSGYIEKLDALEVGRVSNLIGAGRNTIEDAVDLTAGVYLAKKIGDKIEAGETIATLHTNVTDAETIEQAVSEMKAAAVISSNAVQPPKLIHRIIK